MKPKVNQKESYGVNVFWVCVGGEKGEVGNQWWGAYFPIADPPWAIRKVDVMLQQQKDRFGISAYLCNYSQDLRDIKSHRIKTSVFNTAYRVGILQVSLQKSRLDVNRVSPWCWRRCWFDVTHGYRWSEAYRSPSPLSPSKCCCFERVTKNIRLEMMMRKNFEKKTFKLIEKTKYG